MFKHSFTALVFTSAATLSGHASAAQDRSTFPMKPVRLVAPTAPGGGVDTAARTVAQRLTEARGQQVVDDNRAGASELIGTEIVARAAADGHTLLVAPTTFSTSKSVFGKLAYDPGERFRTRDADFARAEHSGDPSVACGENGAGARVPVPCKTEYA